ncbi:MAG TPA: S8 family serine peptidase, partial [Chitinophagaceae bacterium]|nr:S8 family serine peptidase [Chitinophagaceae bacterium]
MIRYAVFACLFLISLAADAQFSRYVIELTDKKGSVYSPADPAAFLSPRAIERRTRQRISIDSTDLPLSAVYLDRIRTVPNLVILNQSKWLNQVCIQTTDANALAIVNSFSFVKKVNAVAARMQSENNDVPLIIEPSLSRLSRSSTVSANNINYGNSLGQIHMHNGEFLHNLGFGGEGIRIAILDAGFSGYKTNPAIDSVRLQSRILGEWDFVENHLSVNEDDSHGLFCFSIIAANRPGLMVGSAPKASFYLYRTEDARSEYPIEEQNWAAAAELADSLGVDMISSSLGYSDFDNHDFDHTYAQRNGNTTIVTRAADLAAKKGMIVMNSAGNSGNESGEMKFIECPADGDSVVAVGAVNLNGLIAGFSSWGPNGAGRRKPNMVSVGQG